MARHSETKLRNIRTDFGLVIPVILALVVCVISFLSLRYVIQSKDDAVLNHAPDLIAVQRLVIASEELNSFALGFLFSRRERERPLLFDHARTQEKVLIHRLTITRSLLPSTEGKEILERADRLAQTYFGGLERAIGLRRSGAPLARVSTLYEREIAPVYQQLIETLAELTRFKQMQFERATFDSKRASVKATWLILLSGLTAILLGALLSFSFIRILGKIRSSDDSLRETLRIRDEFFSVASHELKNPVTALQLQIEFLARLIDAEEQRPKRAEQQALARRCLQETRRLSKLVNDLMDLTRLRLGKLVLERTDLDLGALVREVAEAHAAEADLHGSALRLDVQEPVRGFWDSMRISQVVHNLISNAIKYGDGKPIDVCVDREGARGLARIAVRDHGIGISRETQARIFRPFERGVSEQKIRGLGLGLYIVRQIVDAHGGKVRVRSAPGKGSTFIVELPSREAAREPLGRRAA